MDEQGSNEKGQRNGLKALGARVWSEYIRPLLIILAIIAGFALWLWWEKVRFVL